MELKDFTKEMEQLLTPQELIFIGQRAHFEPRNEMEYYIPDKIVAESAPIEQVDLTREVTKLRSSFLAELLGVRGKVVVNLSPLDLHGRTVEDPKILGIFDEETGGVQTVFDRDLTAEAYKMFSEKGVDLHLRNQSKDKEQQPQRGEAKG